ncbi:MAG: M20/M25/M40 family metallo-hydrolase [Anaerolineales bacterium]|nr:M20/M25/M40 family metallo-hydrolase [Anaerolineales bacterium]MCB8960433.1 M20/M25/M40 family metallo-hydrolase [Ardenticatenales bacterium]
MPIDAAYLLETLKQSIRINSVVPVEEKLSEFIADELRGLGVEPEWHEIAPGRPNVYAMADLGPADDILLLTGHLDTVDVAANWETDPFTPVEKDGRLYGLGSFDMKSGLICCLSAFKTMVEDKSLHGKLGKIAFAATVDEEALGLGAKALLDTKYGQSKGILLTEPFGGPDPARTLGDIPIGLTGKVLYKLTVTGRMAHGFHPERGHNAVEAASKIVAALERLNLHAHPKYGKGNYSTLKFEGGYKEYAIVVPESCEVIITRLTVPGETRDTAVADMRELIDSLNLDCDVKIETPAPFYDPYLLDTATKLGQSFAAAYTKNVGTAPKYAFLKGITDGNIYVAEGNIPTYTFGPSGNGAHECNEYVTLSSLEPVTQTLIDTCVNYYAA